jgi:hypothetical protein
MRKIIIVLLLGTIIFSSCNPMLHITGAGMRRHNLSQNKHQPGKHRKQVRVGTSPNSPFWLFWRRF